MQRACQRQLDDLAKFKGKASPYNFNPKLADKDGRSFYPADNLCAFIERLPHVKGPLAGEPIQLEPWQAFILTTVFGWVKPNGTRRFRRSYIEVPRGNAKSTLSSAVALYLLAADREGGAEVYSLATTRDQARICLLYTSDAADEEDSVDLGGRRCRDDRFRCLLYTSPSPRDRQKSRMPSSA